MGWSFLFPIILGALFVGIFASVMNEGLWSNAITFINIVTAALLATNFFEPLAEWFEKKFPNLDYFWDIVSLWLVFAVAFGLMRTMTDLVSRVRVRFKKPVNQAGSWFFAAWIAWVTVCFTMMTLHTAPLSRNFMDGAFRPEDRMLYGLGPDRLWLGFMQRMSLGPLARWASDSNPEEYVFDPRSKFMPMYATRRDEYAATETFTGKQ